MYRSAVEAMVVGAHVDVVDVEQEVAVGPAGNLAQELPLRKLAVRERHVAGDVFEREPAPEHVLNRCDAGNDVRERFLRVRQRPKIVAVVWSPGAEAEVVRNNRGLDLVAERAQGVKVVAVEWGNASDRQRHAVQCNGNVAAHALENGARPSAPAKEVLGDGLDEIDSARPTSNELPDSGAREGRSRGRACSAREHGGLGSAWPRWSSMPAARPPPEPRRTRLAFRW